MECTPKMYAYKMQVYEMDVYETDARRFADSFSVVKCQAKLRRPRSCCDAEVAVEVCPPPKHPAAFDKHRIPVA